MAEINCRKYMDIYVHNMSPRIEGTIFYAISSESPYQVLFSISQLNSGNGSLYCTIPPPLGKSLMPEWLEQASQ